MAYWCEDIINLRARIWLSWVLSKAIIGCCFHFQRVGAQSKLIYALGFNYIGFCLRCLPGAYFSLYSLSFLPYVGLILLSFAYPFFHLPFASLYYHASFKVFTGGIFFFIFSLSPLLIWSYPSLRCLSLLSSSFHFTILSCASFFLISERALFSLPCVFLLLLFPLVLVPFSTPSVRLKVCLREWMCVCVTWRGLARCNRYELRRSSVYRWQIPLIHCYFYFFVPTEVGEERRDAVRWEWLLCSDGKLALFIYSYHFCTDREEKPRDGYFCLTFCW